MSDQIDTTPFNSATDFLLALAPTNELWAERPSSWIYRGQASAEWKLQATAVRNPGLFQNYGIEGDASHWSQRKEMLDELLESFLRRLSRSGVEVPVPLPTVVSPAGRSINNAEPEPQSFPLMALAQHHGLPTLLLDWTTRAHVAAYFAARDAAQPGVPEEQRLAVWALLPAERSAQSSWLREFNTYYAPASTNPNLRAQSGLFTILTRVSDEPLEEYAAIADAREPDILSLRKITLPVSEAPQLLRLLSYEGIDGASMFPGADGVVRAMREITFWDYQDERRDGAR